MHLFDRKRRSVLDAGDVLGSVLAAWRSLPAPTRAPVTEESKLAAEAHLGRDLPADFRRLAEFSDGIDVFGGSIQIDSVRVAAEHGEELRDKNWPIPADLLVVGGDGSDEFYGLWYPDGQDPRVPTAVIEVGSIFEPDCYAVVGSSLPRFLRTMTAFHLANGGRPSAMDALGMPDFLRRPANTLAPFVTWSDPGLPFPEPDPYVQRLTEDRVRDLVAGFGSRDIH